MFSTKTVNQNVLFLKILSFFIIVILVWQYLESMIVACRILSVFLSSQYLDLSNKKYNK